MSAWILIMVLFSGANNSSSIYQMEALSTYADKRACFNGIKHALTIEMPIAREFRCLKVNNINLKNITR